MFTILLLMKKKRELSEYKAIYMVKDYFFLLFQTIQKDTQELSKVLLRPFCCSTSYSKTGEKLIGMRINRSLIYQVSFTIVPCLIVKRLNSKKVTHQGLFGMHIFKFSTCILQKKEITSTISDVIFSQLDSNVARSQTVRFYFKDIAILLHNFYLPHTLIYQYYYFLLLMLPFHSDG